MSIIRIGLGETKNFAEGYEAIFGKKRGATPKRKSRSSTKGGAAKKKIAKKK